MPSVTLYQPVRGPTPEPVLVAAPKAERPHEAAERTAPLQQLRHTGHRPYAFNGQILGTVCGVDEVLAYWYEVNVFRTVLGAYVSDIRLFSKSVDGADIFRVAEHDDLDALYAYLEGYDPCCDLPPVRTVDGASMSSAALSLRAIELQGEMRRITDHYRLTAGAMLNALTG